MTTLTVKLELLPKFMDENYESHLLDAARKVYLNSCTKENGYITSVKSLTKIVGSYISNVNSLPVFEVQLEIESVLPKIGDTFTSKVCMIFQHGLLVEVEPVQKILIPTPSLNAKGFEYSHDDKTFVSESESISNGAEISVEIVNVRYNRGNFSCIGKMV